ncbi:YceD family protein [Tessaracoccus sp. OS52]|uniref:YceD family protein n=1 Tax=Tessaracoccus sp. OS52 TaxID=2886691 RepID=UPI001D10FF74|nr:YceD family protein [Tessaracoccus sp. OS52]MCC2593258.1 YceD family protein [Tessaracoccus sp. OS52]
MTSVHRKPDRRSPLVIDILELGRGAGSMREVSRTVPAPADLGIEVIGVPEGSDIELDLRLESVVEGVLVSGTATVQLHGDCARCLREIEDTETYRLQELFFYPGHEVEEDDRAIVDESIDLEGVLRDAVVLELPFTPLCEEDCLGLCPECGFNLNDDPAHGHEPVIDARWAALTELDVEPNN